MLTTAARASGHVPDAAGSPVEGDLGTDDTVLLICSTPWLERTREAALRGGEPQGHGGRVAVGATRDAMARYVPRKLPSTTLNTNWRAHVTN